MRLEFNHKEVAVTDLKAHVTSRRVSKWDSSALFIEKRTCGGLKLVCRVVIIDVKEHQVHFSEHPRKEQYEGRGNVVVVQDVRHYWEVRLPIDEDVKQSSKIYAKIMNL